MTPARRIAACLVAGLVLLATGVHAAAPAMPKPRAMSYSYDAFAQSISRPLARAADPAQLVRRLSGNRREACNVDEHDQVRLPSAWWQPRLGFRPVSVEQMLQGPGGDPGPAPGRLLVTAIKTQGVTPGLVVKDSRGTKFAIKFDPPQYPELATGADVVASYLFWAAGYNVPSNTIVELRREDLAVFPDSELHAAAPGAVTPQGIDAVLARARPDARGLYRGVASRWLPRKIGEWSFEGRRRDDAADLVPHELRREIRGLAVVEAWTNNTDASERNTYDAWIDQGDRSFVRHYLIDFSGTLGSSSVGPQLARGGFEHFVDYEAAAASLCTLGLLPPRWEGVQDPGIPSVGLVEAKQFDPASWKAFLPNPAFEAATARDLAWGARIVSAFTDEHIRAAVAMGRYSDPRAADYLTQVLIARRDKIAHRWPGGMLSAN